jgi:hypothetical protein
VVTLPYTPDAEALKVSHGFKSAGWVPTAYDRYLTVNLWLPWFSWNRRKPVKLNFAALRSPFVVERTSPFSGGFQCYGGEFWFSANRRSAEHLLAGNQQNRRIMAHFSKRFIPEESVVHTILCNQPDLKISRDNKRYNDWDQGGHHPKWLGLEDVPGIARSGAHFARKFAPAADPGLLQQLDGLCR